MDLYSTQTNMWTGRLHVQYMLVKSPAKHAEWKKITSLNTAKQKMNSPNWCEQRVWTLDESLLPSWEECQLCSMANLYHKKFRLSLCKCCTIISDFVLGRSAPSLLLQEKEGEEQVWPRKLHTSCLLSTSQAKQPHTYAQKHCHTQKWKIWPFM